MNYYALLVVLILITAVTLKGNQPHNKKYVIIACLLLFSIYGLRNTYYIGVDTTQMYKNVFNIVRNSSWSEVYEGHKSHNLGFYLMVKVFSTYISNDYQLFISTVALFVTICFGKLLYRYSPSPVQSILYHFGLLLFIFHFSALKQSIAMAILMLAFDPLVQRKPIKFILIVLIAGQFHEPSLVFLPAYWITMLRPGKSYLIFLAVGLILTYIFRNQLINLMDNLYKDSAEEIELSNVQFLRTKALIMIVIVVAAVFFRPPTPGDHMYGILLELVSVAIMLQTFCGYSNIYERLADYYFQFAILFIPMVFDKTVKRKTIFGPYFVETADVVAPILFCGYGIYRFLSYVSSFSYYTPFRFFFQN